MDNIKQVVGTIFLENKKILIDKPRKRSTYQMIGGSVEKTDNSILDAAIRECHEELGNNFIFDETKLKQITSFEEIATSDPNLKINMNIFLYTGEFSGELTISDEIENFMWFGKDDDYSLLSNSLKHKVIPMCIENNWI